MELMLIEGLGFGELFGHILSYGSVIVAVVVFLIVARTNDEIE